MHASEYSNSLPELHSFVCVRNRQAERSLSIHTCHVGRVLKTYKLDDTWYASVKLFLRPFDIPPKAVKFNYTLDNYKELVSDSRECISNFEVDEIFSECKVSFCDPCSNLETASSYHSSGKPQFWIRFRLEDIKFNTFALSPVLNSSRPTMIRSKQVLTPKAENDTIKIEQSDTIEMKSPDKFKKIKVPFETVEDVKENNPVESSSQLGTPQGSVPSERLYSPLCAKLISPRSSVRRSLDLGSPKKSKNLETDSEAPCGSSSRKTHESKLKDRNAEEDSDSSCKASWVSELLDENGPVVENGGQCLTPIRLSLKRVWLDDLPSKDGMKQSQLNDSVCESKSVRQSSRKSKTNKSIVDSIFDSDEEGPLQKQNEDKIRRSARKNKTCKNMADSTLESDVEVESNRRRSVRKTRASTCMAESTDDSDYEGALAKRRCSTRKSILLSDESVKQRSRKRSSPNANDQMETTFGSTTPLSKRRFALASPPGSATPLARRTPSKTPKSSNKVPLKSPRTPRSKTSSRTPSKSSMTPSLPARASAPLTPKTSLEQVRKNLHVSAVPMSLPCREMEYRNIYNFVENKIRDAAGGCMYISGVPGTGKTATVHAVIRALKEEVNNKTLKDFQFIETNGLRMTEPRQLFVQVLKSLTGQKCTPQQAQDILAQKFCSGSAKNKTVVLLVDEVDMLRNRRQDVIYNLFDWPSKPNSRFIVLTIANTMDLPERLLKGRVTSRLGLTRLTFQPYSYKQLQEIVMSRLQGSDSFNYDAVELVARKVAACSGDVRRALDICRRASEVVVEGCPVTMPIINQVLSQMMNSANVCSIKNCSRLEKLFLQSVVAENERTGVEETTFISVYRQYQSLCALSSVALINISEAMSVLNRLGTSGLLLTEHSRMDINQSIFLNVSADDIHYALSQPLPTS